jgi:hypothetical protein
MIKRITKAYYSIKGFFKEKRMKKGEYYTSKYLPNYRLMYVGDGTFYRAFSRMCGQVETFYQDEGRYELWEIGILKFKKD